MNISQARLVCQLAVPVRVVGESLSRRLGGRLARRTGSFAIDTLQLLSIASKTVRQSVRRLFGQVIGKDFYLVGVPESGEKLDVGLTGLVEQQQSSYAESRVI